MNEPKKVICETCKYEWFTKSDKKYICCPNCHRTFRREKDFQVVGIVEEDNHDAKDTNSI